MACKCLYVTAVVGLAIVLLSGSASARPEGSGASTTDDRFVIKFKTRQFQPPQELDIDAIREQRDGKPEDSVHFLLQFFYLPDSAQKERLAAEGISLLAYATGHAYIASSTVADLDRLTEVSGVRWAGPLKPADKVSPELLLGEIGRWARTEAGGVVLTLQAHPDVSLEAVEALAKSLGGEVTASVPTIPSVTAIYPFSAELVESLASADSVQYVDVAPPALEDHNDGARAAANVAPLAAAPYNLTGAGVTVLVYDSGRVDASHPDFGTRVVQLDPDPAETVRDHSTHVAGTVAGSGVNSNGTDSAGNANGGTANQWAGMAPAANLRSFGSAGSTDVLYDDAGDLNGDFTTAISNGIDLATMSQGNNVVSNSFPCAQLGDYTNTAVLLDNIVRGSISSQQLIYFESAGNERQLGAPCGQFRTIASPSTAKNTISVGAINSNDNSITGFTSFGPTDDGRLKPDIVAPGCQNGGDAGITSPSFIDLDPPGPLGPNGNLDAGETQNAYVVKCGTSMATPVAAGAAALLVQQWRSTRPARPLGHTVKAILVHTATDLGNAGPDFRFGWGALNARAAIDLVIADDNADFIKVDQVGTGATDSFTFTSNGSANVRVTLAWDDPPATRLAAPTLVNNLDLRLTDPDGVVYQPFTLNAAVGSEGNVATTGNDATNNVEAIIGTAKAGTWTATVTGTAVPTGPQQYTLITPENRAPIARNDTLVTDEDTPGSVNVLANDSDPDGDPLTVTSLTPTAANGSVTCTAAGLCTYTPDPNFNGTDSFTYTVSDGQGGTASATVTVTVNPVNDAPLAANDTLVTDEDTPGSVNVLANDSDPDGDPLTVTSLTPTAANGSVTCTAAGLCTYTPDPNFNGTDSFNYTVSDGQGGTASANVTVTVNPVYDLDHFKCYRAVGKGFRPAPVVVLSDQFHEERAAVRRPDVLCNPVDKRHGDVHEDIDDASAHLTCYRIRDVGAGTVAPIVSREVIVENQFGSQTLKIKQARTLCVPSSKRMIGQDPGPPPDVPDHFKCYKAKGTGPRPRPSVVLTDQFGTDETHIGKPVLFCTPVDKNDEGIQEPGRHLVCYQIDPRKSARRSVVVGNQFGSENLKIRTPRTLCVPSVPPPPPACRGTFDACIDADGIATPGDGLPGAAEVTVGTTLAGFPVTTSNDSGLDMFDNDGNGMWTLAPSGDDLHSEGPGVCATAIRDAVHQPGADCVVLDLDGSLTFGQRVTCDLEFLISFTTPCPANIRFNDSNGNGGWDNGEDIVLDGNNNAVFD
jgi:subtilisin family serine protease